MNWTPITEALPPEGERVEVLFEEISYIFYCKYKEGQWYWAKRGNKCNLTVTAWREEVDNNPKNL